MFKSLAGLVLGSNPWASVILWGVLIAGGFSAGVWLENLISSAKISKLELDAQTLQTDLTRSKADATQAARQIEQDLNARQAKVVEWYQQQLMEREKEHAKHLEKDRKFANEHPDRDFVLPAGTGIEWVREQPAEGTNAAKPDLPEAGGAIAGPDAGAAKCRLSDLLADRDNYKDALDKCAVQVRALQKKVMDDLHLINGAH